jgi:hypothetical protein
VSSIARRCRSRSHLVVVSLRQMWAPVEYWAICADSKWTTLALLSQGPAHPHLDRGAPWSRVWVAARRSTERYRALAGERQRRDVETRRQRLDEIVAFAGLEGFIDTRLKRYSTGMRARLAFAVADTSDRPSSLSTRSWRLRTRSCRVDVLGKMPTLAWLIAPSCFVPHDLGTPL